ncbi:MAG TPA: hypothetical protein PLN93_02185 [Vicinamibacterales bacterium]|nr:hypothetical protein [Vicinamibacterales bacterium]HOQ59221.1 hypothetical protein [Vicinamibacterales bacterium]HPK70724.1 hypothetical protein [Vicinamibacterales bacterium]HPW20522.1 hypothetical protein [Vicinamibacterales bacterium]
MEIYLLPIPRGRHELYCEFDERQPPAGADGRSRWRRWLSRRFQDGLASLDAERRKRLARASAAPARTRLQRIRDRAVAWIAERVAEQRLLWILRGQTAVTLHYPDDDDEAGADRIVRSSLQHDGRYHFALMIVDGLLYLAALPLTPLPGPNVPSIYFSFRAIGHLLSWLGARRGLRRVRWRFEPSAPLADLRRAASMDGERRVALAREVAGRLGLRHLEAFVSRVTLGRR